MKSCANAVPASRHAKIVAATRIVEFDLLFIASSFLLRHRLTVLVLEKLLWIPDSEDPDQTEYDRGRYHQQDPSKYNFPDHFTAFNVWGAGGAMRLS
ncbi:hypothetical protein AGR2A_pb10207 [Agrobacterium genomosp. 2 str. CFBP 5494]|uniref:Uncharacterized protein n=1 Tax=Agrobacterium genomosp. 2 str. CFBP 5494 TaxID=1183436 RepID=A0A9W5F3K9_9HYPH|nr:hypothetical protein AGR2A_pb10207 [Agrobacterium genomosp. 2 str. CFBP 5494]